MDALMAARAKKAGKRAGAGLRSTAARAPAAGAKKASKKAAGKKKAAQKAAADTGSKRARPASSKSTAVAKPKPVAKKRSADPVEGGSMRLSEGATAPNFKLADQSGTRVSSTDLGGRPYVIYFYPKDDTPGCTTEACGFRDALPEFEELGIRVLGVSPDSSATHQKFATKYDLPFTLLSDDDKELASAYGVWALKKNYGREYMGVIRSTFLVGADSVIKRVWRGVRVNGHVAEVRAAAEKLAHS
jgi:peroxiredoxin Q/BCP